jgi:anaerobic selenocysteine-containing dehydrogenase
MTIDVDARIDTKHTFCRLCEVMCGLEVTVTDGEITKVRGDTDHPVSKGFACNKGLLSLDIHRDPDRLNHPLRRTDAGWEEASWPDAVADVADRLREVIDRHGPESVAIYLGNPNAFNCVAGPAGALFLLSLGSTRIFSAATQDCANKFTISDILYGSPNLHPIADLAHTDHLLVLGSNPRISKSSFISVPDPIAAMKGVVERGGTVTFVNPLRIEPDLGPTVQVRPDTDPYLLAAMLHHIDRTVGFDVDRDADHVRHLDELRRWLAAYTPERVAPIVGVDAEVIEHLATTFATAPTAAVHMSTGLNMGRQGALAYFLVQMLSLVTGNLDRPGGNVIAGRAIAPRPSDAPPGSESLEDTPFGPVRRSQGSLPAALLPDWIRHPDTPIRALISVAGNPALSLGGATEMAEALADLDLLVCVDLYRNATGELAHVNLPATDWFERPDLNTFVQGVQTVPHIQFTEALVEPHAERKPEAEIFGLLSEAMGIPAAFGPGIEAVAMMNDGELAAHGLSVAELATRDRGLAVLDRPPSEGFLSGRLQTPDGSLDCAPELVVRAMERADQIFDELAAEPPDQLRLITRRTRNTLNSALANVEKLKSRGADTNPLWMHPDDAHARGLAAGDIARVHNEVGALEAPIAVDANLRPGVVAMTHGFGYAGTPGMPAAHAHPGVNVNVLSPSGPGTFDPLSGMTHLTGIPVEVAAAPSASSAPGSPTT